MANDAQAQREITELKNVIEQITAAPAGRGARGYLTTPVLTPDQPSDDLSPGFSQAELDCRPRSLMCLWLHATRTVEAISPERGFEKLT